MGKATISTATIIRHHAKANANHKKAQAALRTFTIPATFIIVPDFGVKHIFSVDQLDYMAAEYGIKQGHVPGAEPGLTFQRQIASYRQCLTELDALKDEWRQSSGLDRMEEVELKTYDAEKSAWNLLMLDLKTARDVRPIAQYLARESGVLEIYRVKEAMKVMAKRGAR